jgi:hypothetical protein
LEAHPGAACLIAPAQEAAAAAAQLRVVVQPFRKRTIPLGPIPFSTLRLQRQKSNYEYDQENEPTCASFVMTRLVLDMIQKFIPLDDNCEGFYTTTSIQQFLKEGVVPCSTPSKFILFCFIFKILRSLVTEETTAIHNRQVLIRFLDRIKAGVNKDFVSSHISFEVDAIVHLFSLFYRASSHYTFSVPAISRMDRDVFEKAKQKYVYLSCDSFVANLFEGFPFEMQYLATSLSLFTNDRIKKDREAHEASIKASRKIPVGHALLIQDSVTIDTIPTLVVRNSHGDDDAVLYIPLELLHRLKVNQFSIEIIFRTTGDKLGKKRRTKKKMTKK